MTYDITTLQRRRASVKRAARIAVSAGVAAGLAASTMLAAAVPAAAATRTFSGISVTGSGDGYGLVATSGENYDFNSVVSRGNPSGFSGPIVSVSVTADGKGYAEVSSTGQVYAYGTVVPRGNPTGFSGSIVGISVTADGQGYAIVSSAGQNYDYGTVVPRGNPTGFTGNILGVSVTADGQGYANVSSAGQVYAYGTVVPRGNPTGFGGGIVGISVTANGQGYGVVSSAGQNYDYGTVVSHGNATGFTGAIVGLAVTADGQGYADVSSAGQVYAYGSVNYRGNGDPGTTDAASYAKEILANNNIDKSGRQVITDLNDAAAGLPGSAHAPLSATLLRVIAGLGHSHTLTLTALESGGTGHCNNTPKAKCPGDPHYTGHAVDFGTFDGVGITGRNAPADTIIDTLKGQLPSGSGFGQKGCAGTEPSLPAGVTDFADTCNHLHLQLPANAS